EGAPFSRVDLISCRNVLIYLGSHLQKKLPSLFHYALRPDGYLFLGPSESLDAHKELFHPIDAKHRIYQRRDAEVRSSSVPGRTGGRRPGVVAGSTAVEADRPDIHEIGQRILLDEFAPEYAIVDGEGQLVALSDDISK